jgi:hypothetical protein
MNVSVNETIVTETEAGSRNISMSSNVCKLNISLIHTAMNVSFQNFISAWTSIHHATFNLKLY